MNHDGCYWANGVILIEGVVLLFVLDLQVIKRKGCKKMEERVLSDGYFDINSLKSK